MRKSRTLKDGDCAINAAALSLTKKSVSLGENNILINKESRKDRNTSLAVRKIMKFLRLMCRKYRYVDGILALLRKNGQLGEKLICNR